FLTYPLLALVGNLRMLSSSVGASLTPRVVLALVAVPLTYVVLVETTVRTAQARANLTASTGSTSSTNPIPSSGFAFVPLAVWLIVGVYGFSAAWTTRQDRRIAENPHWVLISSWWQVVRGDETVRLTDQFP